MIKGVNFKEQLFKVLLFLIPRVSHVPVCSTSTCLYNASTIPRAVFPRVYMFLLFHVQYFHVYICFYYSTCSISTCIYVSTIPRAVFPRVYMFLLFHMQYFHVYICFYYSTCSISTCIYVSTIPRAVFPRVYIFLLFHVQYFHEVEEVDHWLAATMSNMHLTFARARVAGHAADLADIRAEMKVRGTSGAGSSDTFNADILSISYRVMFSSNHAKRQTCKGKVHVHLLMKAYRCPLINVFLQCTGQNVVQC